MEASAYVCIYLRAGHVEPARGLKILVHDVYANLHASVGAHRQILYMSKNCYWHMQMRVVLRRLLRIHDVSSGLFTASSWPAVRYTWTLQLQACDERFEMAFVVCEFYITSHLLCWASGGGATNSPSHAPLHGNLI